MSRSSTTLISDGASFNGVFSGDSDFLVNGSVEGNCDVSGTVTIAEGGSWSGSIVAANVIVAGRVSGDILSAGQVEIGRTALIEGVVTGEKIALA